MANENSVKLSQHTIAKLVLGYLENEEMMPVRNLLLQTSPDLKEDDRDDVFFISLKKVLKEYKAAKIAVKTCQPEFKQILSEMELPELIKFLINNLDVERVREQSLFCIIEECSICIEEMPNEVSNNIRTLSCSHRFHVTCIETWLARRTTCPYCRQTVD